MRSHGRVVKAAGSETTKQVSSSIGCNNWLFLPIEASYVAADNIYMWCFLQGLTLPEGVVTATMSYY